MRRLHIRSPSAYTDEHETMLYDNVCKFLVETYSQDFAQWLLGQAIGLTELSPTELLLPPIHADALILVADPMVLHLEFQTHPDPQIFFRMADYRLRVYRRFPQRPMRQVVIYLKPTTSALVYQTVFELPEMRHQFEVIRLWEVPLAELLPYPGLLPLAILSRTPNRVQALQEISERIDALPERSERSNVTAATYILAGLVLEKTVIQQILREETMKESVTYQDILQQGQQEGRQEGRQEGEVLLLLRLLHRRFGDVDGVLRDRIAGLPIEQLEALADVLLDFTQLDEVVQWLDRES